MHHHQRNFTNYAAYRTWSNRTNAGSHRHDGDCGPATKLQEYGEAANLVAIALMLLSPVLGAMIGLVCHLVYGPVLNPLDLLGLGPSMFETRAGYGAFMGLLASMAIGVLNLTLHVLYALSKHLLKRWVKHYRQHTTNA